MALGINGRNDTATMSEFSTKSFSVKVVVSDFLNGNCRILIMLMPILSFLI